MKELFENESVSFSSDLGHGCAELCELLAEVPTKIYPGIWFWFSRLYVQPYARRKGAATDMMNKVVAWADEKGVAILNGINPYGEMTLEQLMIFYTKFGFVVLHGNVMYRLPRRDSK